MGTIWSDEHVTQATSGLTKALRIACTRGVKDAEVRKRLKGACSELVWAASPQGKGGDCLWVNGDKDSHRGCSNIFDPLSVNNRGFCSLHESLLLILGKQIGAGDLPPAPWVGTRLN